MGERIQQIISEVIQMRDQYFAEVGADARRTWPKSIRERRNFHSLEFKTEKPLKKETSRLASGICIPGIDRHAAMDQGHVYLFFGKKPKAPEGSGLRRIRALVDREANRARKFHVTRLTFGPFGIESSGIETYPPWEPATHAQR